MVDHVEEISQTEELSPAQFERLKETLAEAIGIVDDEGVPYAVAGSLACITWGRPTALGDIDIVVRPQDAQRTLKAFEKADYKCEVEDPQWLYKAKKGRITVDLIFEMEKSLYLDEAMAEHVRAEEVIGVQLKLMSPEDFLVSQAISFKEDTPEYWYNALGVLSKTDIDWDYLVQRSSRGPRRVLSLLVFAQSNDLPIPTSVIRNIFKVAYEG
ncbi:MAG: nucleotidyltransferase family protein [Actinomycetota bacterium]|nr:nucleotidyltransferase family protein [Actinomycetota bacterium]